MATLSNSALVAAPLPQFHYDIGYDGIFVHYRSIEPFKGDTDKVIKLLKNIKQYMNTDKKGIMLDNMKDLYDDLQKLKSMNFYMVNFETKSMTENLEVRDSFLEPGMMITTC